MFPLLLPLVAPLATQVQPPTFPVPVAPSAARQDAASASPREASAPLATPAHFAPPVRLRSGEDWMGSNLLYPSPRLLDIDGDGALELVLGDLWGKVRFAERLEGDDPLAFGETVPLRTGDREIEFDNW